MRRSLRTFLRNRSAVGAVGVVLLFVLIASFAPWIAPHDPNDTDLLRRLQPPVWMEGGEWPYLLGCDALGRDLLSRIIYGSRVSIFIGTAVVVLATGIGIIAGLLAGYLRGWVDTVISRVVDILLAFPYLLFAIGLMAMMGPGLENIILALAYKEWVIPCRLVRGETLALREVEYIEAARAVGAPSWYIMAREILPNILSPVIVVSTIRMAHVIILEASLSFSASACSHPRLRGARWLPTAARSSWMHGGFPRFPGLPFWPWCWPSMSPVRACATPLIPVCRSSPSDATRSDAAGRAA